MREMKVGHCLNPLLLFPTFWHCQVCAFAFRARFVVSHKYTMSTTSFKSHNEVRLSSKKSKSEAKRNLLILMFDFLVKNGYMAAAEALQSDASGTYFLFCLSIGLEQSDIPFPF